MTRTQIADALMKMAAKRSTETAFGWSHPDCEALQEASRIVKGGAQVAAPSIVDGVLSSRVQGSPVSVADQRKYGTIR